ncbi:MAG: glutathione S-transferase family protein [Geminicoccaceae bacterium]
MIVLYQFARAKTLPSFSPFCMKLECFLKLAGLDYRNAWIADPRKGPKGKAPWIELDGERIGDSELVIDRLSERFGVDVDAGLDDAERARGRALTAMLEDRLLFIALYSRWIEPEGAEHIKRQFFASLPFPVRMAIFALMQRKQHARLRLQGLGLHDPAEMYGIGSSDIDALAATLGTKPFMSGDAPRRVDCTAHAFAANLLRTPFDNPLTRRAAAHPNLVAYDRRMMQLFFPEYETDRAEGGSALDAA